MALITCPECGKALSDKAYACPHCGYPVREKNKSYSLRLGNAGESGYAQFLYVCGIMCFVIGVIFAFEGGKTNPITFSPVLFLGILTPFVLCGMLLIGMARVIARISAMHDIVSGIQLDAEIVETGLTRHIPTTPNPVPARSAAAAGKWKCARCGTLNDSQALSCKNCGEYR